MSPTLDLTQTMPRLVAELHDQFSSLLFLWEPERSGDSRRQRPGEGACLSAKLEQTIKANLRGLGYGG